MGSGRRGGVVVYTWQDLMRADREGPYVLLCRQLSSL